MTVKIYHNPRCTKSRLTLELLKEKGIEPEVKLYLEEGLEKNEVVEILNKIGISPRDFIRKGEAVFKENNLSDKALSDEQLIDAIVKFPKIFERPVVIKGDKAAIGRPPENVLEIL